MPNAIMEQQAKAQAIYMEFLIKKAKEQAEAVLLKHGKLAFDPQGRVLLDVVLGKEDPEKILKLINAQIPIGYHFTNLEAALGKKPTPTTTVSLDVRISNTLQEKFNSALQSVLKNTGLNEFQSRTIIHQILAQPPAIDLQQEFHFHLALANRVYSKLAGDKHPGRLTDAKMQRAHEQAMLEVNQLVMEAYAKALKASFKDGNIDYKKLSKALDKAREEIMPQAHTILLKKIAQNTGVVVTKKELKETLYGQTIKHIAEGTTATPNDLLHTDHGLGLATFITGSDSTAHDRVKGGEKFPHRQIITHALSDDGTTVSANKSSRIQLRSSSLALKKGLANDKEYISDVSVKIEALAKEYDLQNRLSGKPKAFVYNLYTALNDRLDDLMTDNLQTQSAKHIIRGAHEYNAAQLAQGEDVAVLCLVQNISVNGFGDTLGYDNIHPFDAKASAIRTEATLMAEMAALHTLSPSADESSQIFTLYKNYLQDPDRKPYFSESEQGKEAIRQIQSIKNNWKSLTFIGKDDNDLIINAESTLRTLMANDFHHRHEYSKLFESLSVFVEKASLGTCKSGNERTEAINARVAIFDHVLNTEPGKLTTDELEIKKLLYKVGQGNDENQVILLNNALDTVYNNNLQRGASLISKVDQAASAKIETKPDSGMYISRNYAEAEASVMTNLHQSKSGKMQAHKELTKMMVSASEGHGKSFWARMKSSPLGLLGAIVGTIMVIPAIVVAITGAVDNAQKKTEFENEMSELSKVFLTSDIDPAVAPAPEPAIHNNLDQEPHAEAPALDSTSASVPWEEDTLWRATPAATAYSHVQPSSPSTPTKTAAELKSESQQIRAAIEDADPGAPSKVTPSGGAKLERLEPKNTEQRGPEWRR